MPYLFCLKSKSGEPNLGDPSSRSRLARKSKDLQSQVVKHRKAHSSWRSESLAKARSFEMVMFSMINSYPLGNVYLTIEMVDLFDDYMTTWETFTYGKIHHAMNGKINELNDHFQ